MEKTKFFYKAVFDLLKCPCLQVQGLDEESARVIVKTALKGDVLTLNELFVLLVTKEEYGKNAKVLSQYRFSFFSMKGNVSDKNQFKNYYLLKLR